MFFNWEYLSNALPVARRNFISIVAALADSPDDVPHIAKADRRYVRELRVSDQN